ncbi:MAG TPA: hypothetical protein VFE08_05070 [Candidatus Sulfotelmatobacter sp.]|nr:hypothetical protein [Candidatus Sulfotelmatobacter sp.]
MSEKIKILAYGLWIAHPVVQTAIALVMLRRGQYRQFKYFFTYIVAQILIFAVVFPAYVHDYSGYFNLFWATNGISVVLGFQVIHEAFLDVFRPFHTLRDLGTVLFKWAGLVMLLVAGVVSVSTRASDTVPWVEAIMTTQRCVRVIQVGMVLFLLIFARYLGVSRRQHSFGIAMGLGIFAVVELAVNATWSGYRLSDISMAVVNMIAYDCALLIWLGYTLVKSPVREAVSTLLRPQRWEQGLSDLQHPMQGDSLIPMFEGMVDRALLRTHAPQPGIPENVPAKSASLKAPAPIHEFSISELVDQVGRKS